MLSLFMHKGAASTAAAPPAPAGESAKGLLLPESAASLLAPPRRQKLLEHIWQRTSLSRQQFIVLYQAPLDRYAELVQQFPASESHHHAYHGGMLDHGLEIVAYALKLRQSHLLPAGSTPEDQAAQSEAWTAAVAYGALLHDIGKIAVDLHVEYGDGTWWHPWHGPLRQPYRFRYRPDREYRLHGAATGLLYRQVLDSRILDWLSGYPSLWAALLYVLAGQHEHAGILGDLVVKADQASVAQALGGDPAKAMAAPRHALQRKLLDGLRYLLREELKLNQDGPADGWLTDDALWLVSKTVSDKLRAYLLSQGIDGIPSSNTAVFNVLQDHGIVQVTPDGKAIWRATVDNGHGWSNSFTFLKLAPATIWEQADRPAPFSGSVRLDEGAAQQPDTREQAAQQGSNDTKFDDGEHQTQTSLAPFSASEPVPSSLDDGMSELLKILDSDQVSEQEMADGTSTEKSTISSAGDEITRDEVAANCAHLSVAANHFSNNSQPGTGTHFMAWLKQGIRTRRLIVNDAKAQVHTVAQSAYLVSPGIFQRYSQEHPQVLSAAKLAGVSDWQWVQRQFERLRLHRKKPSGLNIWVCTVTGPRKSRRLHGYLLDQENRLFDPQPPDNPFLSLEAQDCADAPDS